MLNYTKKLTIELEIRTTQNTFDKSKCLKLGSREEGDTRTVPVHPCLKTASGQRTTTTHTRPHSSPPHPCDTSRMSRRTTHITRIPSAHSEEILNSEFISFDRKRGTAANYEGHQIRENNRLKITPCELTFMHLSALMIRYGI